MGEIISLEKEYERAFERAKEVLSSGGVIVYPTDTVYGIGGDGRKKDVAERIRRIKKRKDCPFSVLLGNIHMVREYADAQGEDMRYVLEAFPGATTLILKAKKSLPVVREGKIGIRVPEHLFMRKLSVELDMPIITTSANLHGKGAPGSFDEVEGEIIDSADLAIDGGSTLCGMPSTIIDVTEKKVKRVGAGEVIF
jgi:L-threonylcarbamoyladenylate synthase